MADVARMNLDDMIARATRTEQMLIHLAAVIDEKSETTAYSHDAHEALLHGAKIAKVHRSNLEDVRAAYDGKVSPPDGI